MENLLFKNQSRYLTIFQYLQLDVTTRGMTVRESLGELEKRLHGTDNKSAHDNVAVVRRVFNDIVADGILDNDTPMAQSIILIKLEIRLNNEENNDSDNAPDRGVTITRN